MQGNHSDWSNQGLFQPPTWSRATYAPFLDVLAEYLEKLLHEASIYDKGAAAPDRALQWAIAGSITTPLYNFPVLATDHCDQTNKALTCEFKGLLMDEDSSPLNLENSLIRVSSLVPPDTCLPASVGSSMTSAGVAARRCANTGATFAGKHAPSLCLSAYIQRLARYTGCSAACFLYALSYILRVDEQGNAKLSPTTIHRYVSY